MKSGGQHKRRIAFNIAAVILTGGAIGTASCSVGRVSLIATVVTMLAVVCVAYVTQHNTPDAAAAAAAGESTAWLPETG